MSRTGEQIAQAGALLLGKYRVEETLGRGGMGLVVKARHIGLDECVAIKLLRDDVAIDEETIARFLREAQAAVKLKSEHVCRIADVGRFEDGKPYMVMEFLEGADIGQMIDEHGPLHPHLALDLLIQACDALAEAHALGIVHRDVKPSNLFVTFRPDGSAILKVLDFGISKTATGQDLSLTQTSSMLGTPAYMSPEQMRSARKVDARTDIWSLGSVLYEAIEGHLPFIAQSFSEMCVMVAVDPPQQMVKMPAELQPIVMRCLAKHPDGRYNSVAEVASDLARFSRDPERARMLVERMWRTQQRSTFGGVGGQSMNMNPMSGSMSGGIPLHPKGAGLPGSSLAYRPDNEAPSSPAMPNGVVVAPTFDNRSAPVTMREPNKPRRWLWIAIPIVLAGAAAGIVIAIAGGGDGDPEPAVVARPEMQGSGSAAAIAAPVDAPTMLAGSAVAIAGSDSGSGSGSGPGAASGSGSGSAIVKVAAKPNPGAGSGGNTTKRVTPGAGSSAVVQQRVNQVTVGKQGSAATPPATGSGSAAVKQPECDPFGSRTKCH